MRATEPLIFDSDAFVIARNFKSGARFEEFDQFTRQMKQPGVVVIEGHSGVTRQ